MKGQEIQSTPFIGGVFWGEINDNRGIIFAVAPIATCNFSIKGLCVHLYLTSASSRAACTSKSSKIFVICEPKTISDSGSPESSNDEGKSSYAAPVTHGLKCWRKINSKKNIKEWYLSCELFFSKNNLYHKLNATVIFENKASGPKFSDTQSECVSFGNFLRKYHKGKLLQTTLKWMRSRKFKSIKD